MTSEQKKQAVVGVLMLVVVLVLVYQFVLAPTAGTPQGPQRPAKAAIDINQVKEDLETLTNVDPLLSGIKVVNFVYENEHIDRNPMTPVPPAIKKAPGEGGEPVNQDSERIRWVFEKRVTGILYNETNPLAIVDDELVAVGHTYPNGVRIVDIDRDRVIFDVEDARVPLELKEL